MLSQSHSAANLQINDWTMDTPRLPWSACTTLILYDDDMTTPNSSLHYIPFSCQDVPPMDRRRRLHTHIPFIPPQFTKSSNLCGCCTESIILDSTYQATIISNPHILILGQKFDPTLNYIQSVLSWKFCWFIEQSGVKWSSDAEAEENWSQRLVSYWLHVWSTCVYILIVYVCCCRTRTTACCLITGNGSRYGAAWRTR